MCSRKGWQAANVPAETSSIVKGPATIQTMKGILSSGLIKSARYSTAKIGKWWKGSSGGQAS